MKAIIYQTNTGHTLEYAKMLSEELSLPYYTIKESKQKSKENDEIIFLGWIFATKIQGLNKVKKYSLKCIGAVGANPYEKEYIETLKKSNNISQLFYLRGGINFQKLKGLKKIIELVGSSMEKDNPNNKEIVELFKNGANYVSKDNLKGMLDYIKERNDIYEKNN